MYRLFEKEINPTAAEELEWNWCVTSVSRESDEFRIKFRYSEWSRTYFSDRDTHLKFQQKFKVTTGSWDGQRGHWLTAKFFERGLICRGVEVISESPDLMPNKVRCTRSTNLDHLILDIHSGVIGKLCLLCTSVEYSDHYVLALSDSAGQHYFNATEFFDRYSIFLGKVEEVLEF